MKPKWLLETDTFDKNIEEEIKEAVTSQGMEYKVIDYVPFDGLVFDQYAPDDCVIAHGSLGMTQQCLRKTQWVPGAWCNLKHFKCHHYYPRLNKYLLNDEYIILPYGELMRQKRFIYRTLGYDDCVFMRPDSGFKNFTGKVVYRGDYAKDIEFFGFYDVEPEELVIVAEPRRIDEEWRLVIVDKKVVTGSLYKYRGVPQLESGCPDDVIEFATKVAETWQPEKCWVLDVCRAINLRVVEINSFSSSGLYACDKFKVVEAVSKAAMDEWQEYHLDDKEEA
ncbi:MAG: DUF4343 domain-containing protein [Crenarchaeota archaeon]|nr:MAG: DUF4343 domain-containing protein [Thermoproteota archaeon]